MFIFVAISKVDVEISVEVRQNLEMVTSLCWLLFWLHIPWLFVRYSTGFPWRLWTYGNEVEADTTKKRESSQNGVDNQLDVTKAEERKYNPKLGCVVRGWVLKMAMPKERKSIVNPWLFCQLFTKYILCADVVCGMRANDCSKFIHYTRFLQTKPQPSVKVFRGWVTRKEGGYGCKDGMRPREKNSHGCHILKVSHTT